MHLIEIVYFEAILDMLPGQTLPVDPAPSQQVLG
jgi:hypothetical protein